MKSKIPLGSIVMTRIESTVGVVRELVEEDAKSSIFGPLYKIQWVDGSWNNYYGDVIEQHFRILPLTS